MEDLIKDTEFVCMALTSIVIICGISAIYIAGLIREIIFNIRDIKDKINYISENVLTDKNKIN